MQRFGVFSTQSWYLNLSPWQRDLVRIGLELYAREERMKSGYDDYSYVVFPIAKAYEGFLKQYFYDLGFIDYMTYSDRRFRIGRVLNPDVSPSRQDEFWMYGRLAQMCGAGLARGLWDVWLQCRNQVFHYYPDNQRKLTLSEASNYIEMLASAMEQAYQCQTKNT